MLMARKSWEEKSAKSGPRFHPGAITDEVDGHALRRAKALYGTMFSSEVRRLSVALSLIQYVGLACCLHFEEKKRDDDWKKLKRQGDWRNDDWKNKKYRRGQQLNLVEDWKKNKRCYKCKQWGHLASECPTKTVAATEKDK